VATNHAMAFSLPLIRTTSFWNRFTASIGKTAVEHANFQLNIFEYSSWLSENVTVSRILQLKADKN
jgi:hypothetical protein